MKSRVINFNHVIKGIMLLMFTLCSILVIAQPALNFQNAKEPELLEDVFREGYKENVNVSGGVVVGLVMGSFQGIGSINHIILDKSGWPESTTLCVRSSSHDGLFWAENSYKVDDSSLWKISPITKRFHTKLSEYGNKNIIAKVTLSNNDVKKVCGQRETIFAPIIIDNSSRLTVYINSSNRFTFAELWSNSNFEEAIKLSEFDCNRAQNKGASVYDYICQTDLSDTNFSGIAELRVFFDTPFGTQKWYEKVAIPKKVNE